MTRLRIVRIVFGHRRWQQSHAATLHNRFVVKAFGKWRYHERKHIEAAGRLAEDRHIRRVAAEFCDVAAHPCEGLDDIERAVVARIIGGVVLGAKPRMPQPAKRPEPIVDGHDDHGVICRVTRSTINRRAAFAQMVAATVDEEHDGPQDGRIGRCPDVEIEAILIARNLPLTETGLRAG